MCVHICILNVHVYVSSIFVYVHMNAWAWVWMYVWPFIHLGANKNWEMYLFWEHVKFLMISLWLKLILSGLAMENCIYDSSFQDSGFNRLKKYQLYLEKFNNIRKMFAFIPWLFPSFYMCVSTKVYIHSKGQHFTFQYSKGFLYMKEIHSSLVLFHFKPQMAAKMIFQSTNPIMSLPA